MGKFIYEGSTKIDVEDRALAHLQVVVGAKLRRREPFFFTWREDASVGDGRTSVWLHDGASLVYRYHGSRVPQLNNAWLERLTKTANSGSGLRLVSEPAATAPSEVETA